MGLSPMGMMGAGMAFGALSGGLQSYVGGVLPSLCRAQTRSSRARRQRLLPPRRWFRPRMHAIRRPCLTYRPGRQRLTGTLPESIIRFSSRRLQKRGLRRARSTGRRRPTPGHAWEPPMWTPPAQYGAAMAESSVQRALADYGYGLTDTKLKTQALMQRNQADYLRKTGSFYDRTYGYTMRQAGYYYQMSGLYSSMKTGTAGLILNALGAAGMGAVQGGIMSGGLNALSGGSSAAGSAKSGAIVKNVPAKTGTGAVASGFGTSRISGIANSILAAYRR